MQQASEQTPRSLAVVRTDRESAAVFTQTLTRKDPPTANATLNGMMANNQDVWRRDAYKALAAECGGTGATRVRFALTYMTRAEFDRSEGAGKANAPGTR
jgi:hypothetical protein